MSVDYALLLDSLPMVVAKIKHNGVIEGEMVRPCYIGRVKTKAPSHEFTRGVQVN